MAKYPFVPEASDYIKRLNIDIKDLTTVQFEDILNRAEERIKQAILSGVVERHGMKDRVEIASFPIAILLVASSSDSFMKQGTHWPKLSGHQVSSNRKI